MKPDVKKRGEAFSFLKRKYRELVLERFKQGTQRGFIERPRIQVRGDINICLIKKRIDSRYGWDSLEAEHVLRQPQERWGFQT